VNILLAHLKCNALWGPGGTVLPPSRSLSRKNSLALKSTNEECDQCESELAVVVPSFRSNRMRRRVYFGDFVNQNIKAAHYGIVYV
jgi:hypothetical protein